MDQPAKLKKRGRPRKHPLSSEAMTQEFVTPPEATMETQTGGRSIKRAAKAVLSTVMPSNRPVRASAAKARSTIKDAFANPFTKKKTQHPVAARSDQALEIGNRLGFTDPAVADEEHAEARQFSPPFPINKPEASEDETFDEAAEVGTIRDGPKPIVANNEPVEASHLPRVFPTVEPEVGRDGTFEQTAEIGTAVGVIQPILANNEHEEARRSLDALPNADTGAGRDRTHHQVVEVGTVAGGTHSIIANNELAEARHPSPVFPASRLEAGTDEMFDQAANVGAALGIQEPMITNSELVEARQSSADLISEPDTGRDEAISTSTVEEEVRERASALHTMGTVHGTMVEENERFLDQLEFPPAYENEDEETGTNSAGEVDIPKLVQRRITSMEQFKPLFKDFRGRSTPQLYLICSHVQGVFKKWQDEWMALERHIQGAAAKIPRDETWEGDEDRKEAVLGGFKPKEPGKRGKRDEAWPWIAPTTPEPDMGRQTRQRRRRMAKGLQSEPEEGLDWDDTYDPERPKDAGPTTGRGGKRGAAEITEPGKGQVGGRSNSTSVPDQRAAKRCRVQGEASPPEPEVSTGAPAPATSTTAGRKRPAPATEPDEAETVGATGRKRARLASAQPDTSNRVVSGAPKRRGRPPKAKADGTSARGGMGKWDYNRKS